MSTRTTPTHQIEEKDALYISIRRSVLVGAITLCILEALVAALLFTPEGHKLLPIPGSHASEATIQALLR